MYKRIMLTSLIICGVTVFANITYSFLQAKIFINKIREADKINISACFVINPEISAHMITLKDKTVINKLADNLKFCYWSSPFDYLTGNSYMMQLEQDERSEELFFRCGNGLRLKTSFMFQGLRQESISYFIQLAESDGVLSSQAFTEIVEDMKKDTKNNKTKK